MKNIKILLLFVVTLMVAVTACKKNNLFHSGSELNNELLNENKTSRSSSDLDPSEKCIVKFSDSLAKWRKTYGPGGPKDGGVFYTERENAYKKHIDNMLECSGIGKLKEPGAPGPVTVPMQVPYAYTLDRALNIQALLNSLGVPSLCNQTDVNKLKLLIVPLNIIVNRTANNVGPIYYDTSISHEQRFEMILNNIQANEAYLLEDGGFALHYFAIMTGFDFPIPHIVAQTLFGLDPLFVGTPNSSGLYGQIQPWHGFLIDCYDTTISNYCINNPALFLPTPLPTYILYQSSYNLLGQFIPHLATPIFLNSADNKYYLDGAYNSFVPDGYYDSQSETENYSHKYYHIVNGSVTETLTIIVDPNGPIVP